MTRNLTRTTAIAAAALVVAAAAAAASASSGPVTITTPRPGSWMNQHTTPYIAVAGGVTFATAEPTTTRFYLRRDACGTTSDNPHLSLTKGTDPGDGCGLVLDAVGLGGNVDQGASVDFPSSDGMPLAFDASRTVTGVVDITGTAAGVEQVDVSLEALVNGEGVAVGSDTETVTLNPTLADNAVAFTIQPSAGLAGVDIQGLDLRVHISGPGVDGGSIGLSGRSFAAVPAFTASVNRSVTVSLDDPSFSNPIAARIEPSGASWSVAIQTPARGRHTIYVESTQGFTTSTPVSTSVTVYGGWNR